MSGSPQPSTWSRVLGEIIRYGQQPVGQPSNFDIVRRQKLRTINEITSRPLIFYATACTISNKILPAQVLMLDFSDKLAFADITEHIEGTELDIMLHSPGGRAEAVESIVDQLRRRFTDIRFIIPNFAKSAATMMAMSGNQIIMDPDAELGPIDPQMNTTFGIHAAQSIIEQFEEGRNQILEDQRNVPIWGPILANLAPSLLVDCRHAIDLSKRLVRDWLRSYMFSNDENAESKAEKIVSFLSNLAYFKSHARRVTLKDLQDLETEVIDLNSNQELSNAVKEAYCAFDLTLSNTPAVRIVENHIGNAVIRTFSQAPIALQLGPRTPRRTPPRGPQDRR